MQLTVKIAFGFSFLIGILILVSASVYKVEQKVQLSQELVAHTHEVIGKANLLHRLIVDMETGQRGFIITGKHSFLDPFKKGKENYHNEIHELIALVSDNPVQLKKLNEINRTIDEWLEKAAIPEIEAREKIELVESQYLKIIDIISQETGKNIMDRLRTQFSAFVIEEESYLRERQDRIGVSVQFFNKLLIIGTVVGIVVGLLSMLITINQIRSEKGREP